jgi:hypothetical protein
MAVNAAVALAMLGGTAAGSAPPVSAATALATFRRATAPGAEARGIAQEAQDPVTLRALDQFDAALEKATDLKRALTDPRILGVLLPALGLADRVGFPALAQRALTSDPGDPEGLAAKLGGAWTSAARTLQLHRRGLEGLKDPATVGLLRDAFLSYRYRTGLDAQGAGVADALYARERAGTVRDVYTVLGDPVLRRVVTGALGLPESLAVQSVEAQARAVGSRLDIDSLQSPAAVEKLVSRYLIARAGPVTGGGVLALFA